MEYKSFLKLFDAETKDIIEKNGWTIYTPPIITEIEKLTEALGRVLISAFAAAVSEGEVTVGIFTGNIDLLYKYAINYNEGKVKHILETQVSPELYLSEVELFDKIKTKFDSALQKTDLVKKITEEQVPDMDIAKLMEGMMGGVQKKQNTKTKRKRKPR
jgi:hypothetical protein